MVERAVEATINGRAPETAYEALDECDALRADLDLLGRSRPDDGGMDPYSALVLDAIDWTANHGGNVAERALKMGLRAE